MLIDKGPCSTCGAEYETTYTVCPFRTGECFKCFMDRSRGPKFVEGLAQRMTQRARVAKIAVEIPKVRGFVREARRAIAILKDCHGR